MGKGIMRDGLLAALGRVEAAFKLRYMGIGLVWAWLYGTYTTSAVFPDRQGQSINADESWLASAVAVVLTFFVGGLLLSRTTAAEGRLDRLSAVAALLLSVGTVASAFGGNAVVLSWGGGTLTGIGYALLSMLWAQALVALDVEELEVAVPLASLLIVPCVVLFPFLEGAVGVAAAAALPLLSGGLLLLCRHDGNIREGATRSGERSARGCESRWTNAADDGRGSAVVARGWGTYLGRVAGVLAVLYVAIGWQAALAGMSDGVHALVGVDVAMLMASLASVALGVAIVFFSKKVSFSGLFRWAVPFTVVTLVLRGVSGLWAGFVGNAVGDTLDSLVQVLVYLLVITLAKQGKVSAPLGVGLLNGAVQLGVLLGNLGGALCLEPMVGLSPSLAAAALICLVALSGIVMPQREPVDGEPALVGADALERSLLEGCRRLQERSGLSDRETEIAFLIARGYSRPYIREKLFISKNTVATHIRHIYGKLAIHSKEELIDLVSEAAKE